MGLGPPKVMKNGSSSATTLPGSLAYLLSSRPKRSVVERPAVCGPFSERYSNECSLQRSGR
jgi:hypothetical protein